MRVWIALELDDPVALALIAGGYAQHEPGGHGQPEARPPTMAELQSYAKEHGLTPAEAKARMAEERRGAAT